MRSKKLNIVVYALTALFLISSAADAQFRRRPRRQKKQYTPATSIGVRFGNDFKHDQLLLGGHLWMPLGIFWKLAPSFEYYFIDEEEAFHRWQFNGDLMFKPHPNSPFYLGGGVAVNNLTPEEGDSHADVGGNVLVGFDFGRRRMPSMYPYVQARWTIMENETYFSLLGGISLNLN